jgi:hypothetical protein
MKIVKTTLLSLAITTLALHCSTSEAIAQTVPNYSLSPAGSTVTAGSNQTLQLRINTGTNNVTSMEILVDVTGTSVPTNLVLNPIAPTGMSVQLNQIVNITGGKQFQYVVMGGAGTGTINTNGTNVSIGTITFTAPTSGSANFKLNTASTMYAGTSGNVLTGFFNETYTFQATASPTPTPTRIPTPTVTPTRIPTVTPTPVTINPTVTPTTAAGSINITTHFRFQAVTSNIGNQTVRFTIRDANTGAQLHRGTYSATGTTDGKYSFTAPVTIASGNYYICVKSDRYRSQCFNDGAGNPQTYTLTSPSTTLDMTMANGKSASYHDLQVGDVNNDDKVTIEDLNLIQSAWNQYVVVNPTDPNTDLNRDSRVTVEDLALLVLNFNQFTLLGDELRWPL